MRYLAHLLFLPIQLLVYLAIPFGLVWISIEALLYHRKKRKESAALPEEPLNQ